MTGQLELWRDDWAVEPCDTAPPDPDEQAHTDLHNRRPRPIPGDHGQPPGRPRNTDPRVIDNVLETL